MLKFVVFLFDENIARVTHNVHVGWYIMWAKLWVVHGKVTSMVIHTSTHIFLVI